MGYRIEYGPVKKVRGLERRCSRRAALTAMCLLLFSICVGCFWPKGADVMRNLLFSGDAAVTAAAMENLTEDLQAGEPVTDVLRDFCVQIIDGANLDSDQ